MNVCWAQNIYIVTAFQKKNIRPCFVSWASTNTKGASFKIVKTRISWLTITFLFSPLKFQKHVGPVSMGPDWAPTSVFSSPRPSVGAGHQWLLWWSRCARRCSPPAPSVVGRSCGKCSKLGLEPPKGSFTNIDQPKLKFQCPRADQLS